MRGRVGRGEEVGVKGWSIVRESVRERKEKGVCVWTRIGEVAAVWKWVALVQDWCLFWVE